MKQRFALWLYQCLSQNNRWVDGYPAAPGDALTVTIREENEEAGTSFLYASSHEEGQNLWMFSMQERLLRCSAMEARRLAWFILWQWWICETWCGLRSHLWRWAREHAVIHRSPLYPTKVGEEEEGSLSARLLALESDVEMWKQQVTYLEHDVEYYRHLAEAPFYMIAILLALFLSTFATCMVFYWLH